MDQDAMLARCAAYQDHGYFTAEGYTQLQAEIRAHETPHAQLILRNFAQRYYFAAGAGVTEVATGTRVA